MEASDWSSDVCSSDLGEPFLNSETLKMIIYADKNTDYEIGCATNATLLNEEIIGQLSETRIKLNIQFPAINPDNFINITQSGKLDALLEKFRLLQNHKVQFGLNHVITDTNFESLKDVIEFAGTNNYPLKLLPDLNNVESVLLKDKIFPFLDEMTDARIDKQTGAIKWVTKTDNGSEFQVMYVDSPCFYKNFNICKNFAEIRLLPNMRLQTCIKKQSYSQSDFVVNNCDKESIKLKFQQAWNDFISC
jgi:cyclic pyranopterin phosphate synthase